MSDEIEKSPEAFRTITEVSRWLDTPAHVLRFWESRFPEVAPVKRAGGRRYYRPEDMKILGGIKAMLHDQGQSIREVQERLAEGGLDDVRDLSPDFDFTRPPSGDNEDAPAARLTLGGGAQDRPPAEQEEDTEPAESADDTPEPVADALHDSTPDDVDAAPADTVDAPAPYELSEDEAVDETEDLVQDMDAAPATLEPAQPEEDQPALFPEDLPEAEPPQPAPPPSAFRSRRSRSQDAESKGEPAAPIRGFFFNDIDEPALGASDDLSAHLLEDDDNPEAFAGFSALGERAQAEREAKREAEIEAEAEAEAEAELVETTQETASEDSAPDEAEPEEAAEPDLDPAPAPPEPPADPIDLADLPKDPGPADLPWPAAPVLTAELRALTGVEMRDRLAETLPDLAARLQSLQGRLGTRSGNP